MRTNDLAILVLFKPKKFFGFVSSIEASKDLPIDKNVVFDFNSVFTGTSLLITAFLVLKNLQKVFTSVIFFLFIKESRSVGCFSVVFRFQLSLSFRKKN